MTTRRSFLASILAAGVAPAAVGSGILMPVRRIITPASYFLPMWGGDDMWLEIKAPVFGGEPLRKGEPLYKGEFYLDGKQWTAEELRRIARSLKNATSWANAIFNSQPNPPAEVARIMVLIRTAYEKMKGGAGTDDDFDRVGCAINVGMIRAEAIDPQLVQMFQAAGEALLESDRIRKRHGAFGFTGPHILSMNAAMDLYEQVLSLSTPNQMESAVQVSMTRIRRREVIQA